MDQDILLIYIFDLISLKHEKAKHYPRKDEHGRLKHESQCTPFILTSMGGLCREGHDFLRVCRKRDTWKTRHLEDVLITQHAKWTASRIRRSLFGQQVVTFPTCSVIQNTQDVSRESKKGTLVAQIAAWSSKVRGRGRGDWIAPRRFW